MIMSINVKHAITRYPCLANTWFCWVGQNAITGEPNRLTGRSSLFGRFYSFASRSDRDRFVADYYDCNGNNFAVCINLNSGREYELGVSVADYIDHLARVAKYDRLIEDENGYWNF